MLDFNDYAVRSLHKAKKNGDFAPTPEEDEFIDSLYKKVDELGENDKLYLHPKQTEKLEELYNKYWA